LINGALALNELPTRIAKRVVIRFEGGNDPGN
jgi:hypothetical protein